MATKKQPSTAVTVWEEELAKQAVAASALEASTSTAQFFSFKGGRLAFNDAMLPGNQMAVIILDSILETVYYEGAYDPDEPAGPTAFALGRDEKTLTWHENSDPEFAGKLCSESDVCQWGSADVGRGKAAKETRRLAMIPAGTFENDKFVPFTKASEFEDAPIAYMRLPVTSVKGYSGYVKQVATALKRPPHGMFTRVKVEPDPNYQFRVLFDALSQVPNDVMGVIMARHAEAKESISFPYVPMEKTEAPKKGGKAQAKSNKASPPARGKRY